MATSIISAGDAANLGVQTTGGDDGVLVLRSGAAGAKVDALSIAASGAGTFVGEVTATGFTGTLDGVLGGGTPAAANVTTLAASGDLTANNFAGKNRIINGAMRIDQRNSGVSVTLTNGVIYVLDRYRTVAIGTSLGFSSVRSATAPAGFSQSYLATVTSAKSVAATDQTRIDQFIEGYNVADLNFGTANAKTITLSFWVRSSVTGTYCVHIGNSASPSRSFLAEYTISSADTFEYKTITISGDTTGTWTTVNGAGLGVSFVLGMGSNFTGSAGWQAGEKYQTSNQTQWIGTSGATFYFTGVQIEAGSAATEFEHRNFGEELALCQRYYYQTVYGGSDTTIAHGTAASATVAAQCGSTHPVTMRAIPTLAEAGTLTAYDGTANGDIGISVNSCSITNLSFNCTASSLTEGRAVQILANAAADYLTLTAEL